MDKTKTAPQVFLSYASEDRVIVQSLYERLTSAGYRPWMDKMDILPGQDWMESIRSAIKRSDFFLACLSPNSINKQGVLQEELKLAMEIWREMKKKDIYLIPVRFTDCDVPSNINHLQWVDLFQPDGFPKLEKSLRKKNPTKDITTPSDVRSITSALDNKNRSLMPIVTPAFLTNLHQGMVESYNLEEIKTLCLELGIDYENLEGQNKAGKIRELITYLNRRGQLLKLVEKCTVDRPEYPWQFDNRDSFSS